MAKTWIQATRAFTQRIGVNLIVGHPNHPDPRGKAAEVDDGAQVDMLVASGKAKRISRAAYLKIVGGEDVDAGENRVAQTAGQRPKVSARLSTLALMEEARVREVDTESAFSKDGKVDRTKLIALINDTDANGGADEAEGTDNQFSSISRLTADSTSHPQRVSPQNDVNAIGTVDKADPGLVVSEELRDQDDEAPAGGSSDNQ